MKYHPDKNPGDEEANKKFSEVGNGTFLAHTNMCDYELGHLQKSNTDWKDKSGAAFLVRAALHLYFVLCDIKF